MTDSYYYIFKFCICIWGLPFIDIDGIDILWLDRLIPAVENFGVWGVGNGVGN